MTACEYEYRNIRVPLSVVYMQEVFEDEQSQH